MLKQIIGFISLKEPILCKKEVLGCCFESSISGIKVNIEFPSCPLIENDDSVTCSKVLLPPSGASFKIGNEPILWGYVLELPTYKSTVCHLSVSYYCEDDQTDSIAQRIYESIDKWQQSFLDYLGVSSKQAKRKKTKTDYTSHLIELFGETHIPKKTEVFIATFDSGLDYFADCEQVKSALLFAGSGEELLLERQMLLSAYKAWGNGLNRLAIVDACSAMEICLVKYLKKRCKELDLDDDLLIKRFRSLGDKIKLAKSMDKNFPEVDFKSLVVSPRNDTVHYDEDNEVYLDNKTTCELIKCVEICLEHYLNGKYYPGE